MSTRRYRALTVRVSIALAASMLSIVPSVSALPVHDGGGANNDGVRTAGTQISTSGNTMNITSTVRNNVIGWKDFSIASGETVQFDGGAKTNNYLNIVTGKTTATISGALQGGKNVYIVSPNGVYFGKDANVNVGNLYVSTREGINIDSLATAANAANAAHTELAPSAVLPQMSVTGAAFDSTGLYEDVVSVMDASGKSLTADSVHIEGKRIRLLNSDRVVSAGGVHLFSDNTTDPNYGANGYIHIGNGTGVQNSQFSGDSNVPLDWYQLIYTKADWNNAANAVNSKASVTTPDKNYMLAADIDFGTDTAFGSPTMATFGDTAAHAFNGKFDGMFYTYKTAGNDDWSNAPFTNVKGLGTLHDQRARIDNFGFRHVISNPYTGTWYTGHILNVGENVDIRCMFMSYPTIHPGYLYLTGVLTNSSVDNSFVYGNWLRGNPYVGGIGSLIESANNVKVRNSYLEVGGDNHNVWSYFIRSASNNTTVENSYMSSYYHNTVFFNARDASVKIKNSYAVDTSRHVVADANTAYDLLSMPWDGGSDSMDLASYAAWGNDISNEGGSHATWRLYEGRRRPLLRSFLQGGSIIADKFNYGYIARDGSYDAAAAHGTAVNGAAITKDAEGKNLVYNGKYMEVLTTGNAKGGKNDVTFSRAANLNLILDSAGFSNRGEVTSVYSYINSRPLDDEKGAINAGTTSLLFSDPFGYDIIGSNVTMEKKKIAVDEVRKVWDKTSTADPALQNAIGNDKVSFTGDTSQFNAYMRVSGGNYYESDGTTLRSDVGKNLKIKDTAIALNGSYKMNYDIDLSDLRGSIVQRPIAVDIAYPTTSADMTYNGSAKLTQVAGDTHWTGMTAAVNLAENQQVTGNPNSGYVGGSAITWAHRDGRTDGATEAVYMRAGADSKDAGTYTKDADAGTGLVYRNFALAGADAKNYYVTDKTGRVLWQRPSDGVGETKDGLLYTSGKIWKKDLVGTHWTTAVSDQFGLYNKNSGAEIQVEKTYDGTSTVLSAKDNVLRSNQIVHTTAGGNTTWDDITLTVTQADYIDANSLTASTAPDATDNGYAAHRAIAARYSVMPTGESVKNYTLNGVDLTAGTAVTNAITTAGRINRRTVKIKPLEIEKRYDGVANVVETDTSLLPSAIYGGNIGYLPFLKADGTSAGYFDYASDDEKSHFLPADKVTINITGQFQATSDPTDGGAHTVYYGAGGTATTPQQRDVQYLVSLHPDMSTGSPTWAKSGNYRLQSEGDTSAPGTVHDINAYFNVRTKGTILPARITNIKFQDIEKLYDGTNEVKGAQAINRPRIDKVTIEGQEVARGQNLTYGQPYGFYQEYIFKSDGAGYVTQPHPTGFAGTYAQKDVKWNGTPGAAGSTVEQMDVTYTGLDKLLNNKNYVIEPSALTGKGKINPIRINPGGISGGIVADWNHIKKTYDATTDLPNEARSYLGGTGAGAFQVTDTSGQVTSLTLDDFNITGKYAAKNVGNQWVNLTFTPKDTKNVFVTGAVTQNAYGSITPREIEVSDFKNIRKTYDRNLTYTPSTTDPLLKIGFLQKDITDGTVTYSATAVFDGSTTANASTMAGGVYNKDKTVNYTLAISGADVGNYKIMDGTTVVGNGSVIQKANQGAIEKRKVDVAIDAVTRDYNGTVIAAPTLAAGKVHLYSAGTTTADAAAAADGITGLDTSASSTLSGEFQNTDGTANKNAGTHKVKWSNITANVQGGGSLRDNYIFNDTYLGDGTITKLNLGTMTLNLKPGTITKTYDGTTAVKKDGTADETAWRSLLNRIDVTTGLGTSVLSPDDYSITAASYDSKNVSTGGAGFTKTVNYTIKLNDAQNYTATGFNAAGERTLSQANMGEVKPLELQVQFKDVKKTYDRGLTYTPAPGTQPISIGFLAGDAASYTSSAAFDAATNANASTMTGGVYNKDKTVNYTVNFTGTDAANYKIMDGTTQLASGNTVQKANKGTIEKRKVDVAIDAVTRDYNGTVIAAPTLAAGKVHLYSAGTTTADAAAAADGITGLDTSASSTLSGEFQNTDGTANKNAGTHKVKWSNITANVQGGGSLRDNYIFNDTYLGDGTITKLNLGTMTLNLKPGTITKTYDGTTAVKKDGTADETAWRSLLNRIDVTTGLGTSVLSPDDYSITAASYDSKNVSTGGAGFTKTVNYTIKLNDAQNYTATGFNAAGERTLSQANMGEVKPLELQVQFNDISKSYDSTLTYTPPAGTKPVAVDFFTGDAVTLTSSADFDGATMANASTMTGGVYNKDKTVNYTVNFTGTDAANYKVMDGTTQLAPGTAVTRTKTNKGTIERRRLDIAIDPVTRAFDDTAAAASTLAAGKTHLYAHGTQTADAIATADGIGVDTSAASALRGEFRDGTTPNSNAGTHDVHWRNLRNILMGAAAGNYDVNADYTGAGTITKLNIDGITSLGLNGTARKVYDGDTVLRDSAGTATDVAWKSFISDTTGLSFGTLTRDKTSYTVMGADYDGADVATGRDLTYKIKLHDAGNYQSAHLDAAGVLTVTNMGAGEITRRELRYQLTHPNLTKEYDGTTTAKWNGASVAGDEAVTFTNWAPHSATEDAITNKNRSTAVYTDKNAGTGKTVNYTLAFAPGLNMANYTIVDAADAAHTPHAPGSIVTGAGEIARKNLSLTVSNEVTKVYDGKKAWTNGMTGDSVTLHTGDIVTGDSVNLSNSYQMGSAFNSKNVADAKTFTYDDIRLSGADAANYTLQGRYADGSAAAVSENPGGSFKIITKGRIIPKLLDVALDNAAIHKEYDGTKLVADRAGAGTHFSTVENITTPTAHSYRRDAEGKAQSLDIAGVTGDDGAETLHVSLANRAPEYDDSNVRYDANGVPESMPVTYWLRWDDANYRLAGAAGWTLTGAQQGELKTAGTILPKEVTASISGTIWKTYDGTLDMGDAAGRAMHNIRFTGLTVPGETDAAILGGTVVGGHFNGSPDAATSETQDYDLTGHSFDYTVGITNRNYRLAGAAADGTVQINGAAEIHRKEIYAKPDTPAPIRQGEPAPERYTGHVEGLLPADDTPDNQARFTYGLAPGVALDTNNVGSYPIHGYYNGRTEGNFLKNYRFSSVPAQMNVLMNAPERDYDDALAPFRKFRPDDHAYQFASFDDDNVASFYRKPSAALNYEGDGTRIPDKTAG